MLTYYTPPCSNLFRHAYTGVIVSNSIQQQKHDILQQLDVLERSTVDLVQRLQTLGLKDRALDLSTIAHAIEDEKFKIAAELPHASAIHLAAVENE